VRYTTRFLVALGLICVLAPIGSAFAEAPPATASPVPVPAPATGASPVAPVPAKVAAPARVETADQIIDKVTYSAGVRTEQVDVAMQIFGPDAKPREEDRTFRIQGRYSPNGGDSEALIQFLSPRGIKGTKILTIKKGGTTGQWIYLPAFKKVSRINSEEDVEGILDSDLSYSDIKGESTTDYKYTLNSGKLEEYAKAVCREPAYSVSAVSREGGDSSPYGKRTLSISKSRYFVCGVVLYDKAGKLVKNVENTGFVKVGDSWRPGRTVISSLKSASQVSSKTTLTYSGWKSGVKLGNDLFTVNALSQ
jgi:hypothetical protein